MAADIGSIVDRSSHVRSCCTSGHRRLPQATAVGSEARQDLALSAWPRPDLALSAWPGRVSQLEPVVGADGPFDPGGQADGRANLVEPVVDADEGGRSSSGGRSSVGVGEGLVGRTAELAAVLQVVSLSTAGTGQLVVVVEGDPGIGKTALARAAARSAATTAGCSVLTGAASPSRPYGLLVDALVESPARQVLSPWVPCTGLTPSHSSCWR